jgi:transcriptional regulator with XRE-family HTH domain
VTAVANPRSRPKPKLSKRSTRLAARRIEARLTQKEMAALTGISLVSYRRLERGEIDNPSLRQLVNCAHVLRSRLPDLKLSQLFEPEWLRWKVFDAGALNPPARPATEYELFPE